MKRIICLGDSNTYGRDPHSFIGSRYREDIRWTSKLQDAGFDIVNLGMNGRTVPGRHEGKKLCSLIQKYEPADLLLIMLGTNDILRGYSASETAAKAEKFLIQVRENTSVPVLFVAPPHLREGSWVTSQKMIDASRNLSSAYEAVAEKLDTAFCDAGDWAVGLTSDGVHLSSQGNQVFYEGIFEAICRMYKEINESEVRE